jgi:hypothetical protein
MTIPVKDEDEDRWKRSEALALAQLYCRLASVVGQTPREITDEEMLETFDAVLDLSSLSSRSTCP